MNDRRSQRGQILPLFVFSLVALLAVSALLIDGAFTYVQRRRLQDAGDAAALSASNYIQSVGGSCSATFGPPPGPPRPEVRDAVLASIAANVPGFPTSDVFITCPTEWLNIGVRVELRKAGTNFLASSIGLGPLGVATTSTAINGRVNNGVWSIVLLNPWQPTWPQAARGCPSLLLSGGPTVIFDGSVYVDSACPAGNGGALGTNGGAATLTMNNGAQIRLVGGYNPGSLAISPPPATGQPYFADPLAWLPAMPWSTFAVRSNSKLVLNNTTQILQPGIYRGGIELRNSSIALLRPGIYVFDGGGLSVGAQASICSMPASGTPSDCSNWSSVCQDANCGVLFFNRGTASGSTAMGQIQISAGAVVKLKAYEERAMGGAFSDYQNLLLWQDASPAATGSYRQPVVWLNGGGNLDVSGTIYAPQALVHLGGTSGGGGGGAVDLTVQFIVWDFEIQGNASFHFFYGSNEFVIPKEYGLVQ
jgi:hypothetical protein